MEQDKGQEHEQEVYIDQGSCFADKETGILNKEGQNNLNKLYVNNGQFRDEIMSFVKNKIQLNLEAILDRRYKTKTLNTTGKNCLTECVTSKDNTKM